MSGGTNVQPSLWLQQRKVVVREEALRSTSLWLLTRALPPAQSLKYARAASVVRAAAFRITPTVRPGELPFCGTALAAQIADLAASGTTRQLREHECAPRLS